MQLSDFEEKQLEKLDGDIKSKKWSNAGLVQLIELAGAYLNILSVPDYAKQRNISDVAARKNTNTRKNLTIFNTKFVIDND